MIDLDSNATTRLLPEVLDAMLPWLSDGYANPSGSYRAAKQARLAIDQARAQVAALIEADPDEIIFTSGGTESNNTALASLDQLTGPGAVVVSAIEHSAILRRAEQLSRKVCLAPVLSSGRLDLDALAPLLDETAFISIMAANNETGVIQPLTDVIQLTQNRRIPLHSDIIQVIGKIPFSVRETPIDLGSLSAHKFHGPKGIGAIYLRRGLNFKPMLWGGGQESSRRSGTENTAAIVGMGVAAACAMEYLSSSTPCVMTIRDAFEHQVLSQITGVTVNGEISQRLPNTSHLSFDQCDAAGLLILLDEAGIQCSAGSACMSGKQKPSHVQLAMQIPESRAKSSLRISFSRLSTIQDAIAAANAISKAVEKIRRIQGTGIGSVVVYSP